MILLDAAASALLVIDVQEKLMAKIPDGSRLVSTIKFLIDAARLLGVPVTATEQYPKGLGPTVPELLPLLPERPEKLAFSCCAVPGLVDSFQRTARLNVVLVGIETHVCVLHTAVDLMNAGLRVFLAVDALSSRATIDHVTALRRLETAGAVVTTAETVIFEWLRTSASPHFKTVSRLIQDRMKIMPSTD